MNDMHFTGKIVKAWFHPGHLKATPFIQLRIIIDVVEEILIEEYGSEADLCEKFLSGHSPADNWELSLTGRPCKIVRNASGYHFISFVTQ